MKYKELLTKPEAEIRKMLEDLKREAHDISVKIRMNELKQTHKLATVKKDIARVMTHLHNFKTVIK